MMSDQDGPFNAFAGGGTIGSSAFVGMGSETMRFPMDQKAFVLGHELGHLHFRDGPVRGLLDETLRLSLLSAAIAVIELPLAVFLLGASAAAWLPALGWYAGWKAVALLALPSAGFLALRCWRRLVERRADLYGAWLTHPVAAASWFRTSLARAGPGRRSWIRRLLRSHPTLEERMRGFESLAGGDHDRKDHVGNA
jgi:Zn-dependent protease with chaperone function